MGCLGSAGLPCVFWASLTPGRSRVAVQSPLFLRSKLWAPASYKWLHDHAADYRLDFVSLWKPPLPTLETTTDLVLWQALTQGETMQRCGLRQFSLSRERSCFSGEEVDTRRHPHVPDRAWLSRFAVAFPRPGELEL